MLPWAHFLPLVTVVMLVACGGDIAAAPPTSHLTTGAADTAVSDGKIVQPAIGVMPFATPGAPAVTVGPTAPPGWLRDGWKTNISRRTVDLREIRSGGPPRDGIPPIDHPQFVAPSEADTWIGDTEPVVALEIGGEARAYPLQILTWHEIVNDVVGGAPVTVTFCPLCNTAIAYDRSLGGTVLDFGTSGLLRESNLVMWDRQTESLWQQFTGEAIVGDLAGKTLERLPVLIISYAEFKASYPVGSRVLSRDTGARRPYGTNPYAGYDRADQSPFLFDGTPDTRLAPMERVVTVGVNGQYAAYAYASLAQKRVVNDTVGGRGVVVVWRSGTVSALDRDQIAASRDVGATAVYDATLDGRALTFAPLAGESTEPGAAFFRDNETGSGWTLTGKAVSGPLAGVQLASIVHGDEFWFVWAAFLPATGVRQ